MALNYVWVAFFLIAFVVGVFRMVFGSTPEDQLVMSTLVDQTFESAKDGFEYSLKLTGVLTLWLGLMKVGEAGGVVAAVGRLVRPLFARLFSDLPKDHPVHGSMVMNLAANVLGLDNAATPLGLKAMSELQELNTEQESASNAQIMFLVLNTSGLTAIPISVMVYRAQAGAANPADIFIPILLTTACSTLAGLLAVAFVQRIRLRDPVILAYLLGIGGAVAGLITYFSSLDQAVMEHQSKVMTGVILFSVITWFIAVAAFKRVNVYETFIEGAKEGFGTAVKIIPFLVAMLVGIGVFRACGALDFLLSGLRWMATTFGWDTAWVDGMPTAVMKPFTGGGARAMMVDTMEAHGADSFAGRLASTFQGSTDTTFYILAVYFGSVSIRRTRHAVPCGLIADAVSILAGIFIAYLFFGGAADAIPGTEGPK